jgi:poly(hydroxyalkanoate) depolymerase family esterase
MIFLGFAFHACGDKVKRGYITVIADEDGYHYDYYIPSSYTAQKAYPMFVVLHGGTQTAEEMATMTQMNQLAETYQFIVLYPEQSTLSNAYRYWNWFLPTNQTRENGEPLIISDMMNTLMSKYRVDKTKIYAVGFSAGACMALHMAILYPDIISGVAMASGLGYGVAMDGQQAYIAMNGTFPSVKTTAELAYENMPVEFRRPIKILVVHGDEDTRVNLKNADYIISQISYLNDLIDDGIANDSFLGKTVDVENRISEGRIPYSISRKLNQDDQLMLLKIIVSGMPHRWSGGDVSNAYSFPDSIDISTLIIRFMFGEDLFDSAEETD